MQLAEASEEGQVVVSHPAKLDPLKGWPGASYYPIAELREGWDDAGRAGQK